MNELIIPINGKDTKIKAKKIDILNLSLDESNPRISFFKDNQITDDLSDDQIMFALVCRKPAAFNRLKESIHNNRGIINPIWVEPIKNDKKNKNKYRVIEGNTRVVIYRELTREEPSEAKWNTILCHILPYGIDEGQLNFIRLQSHLRGTTEWDAYEKAKYLYKLWKHDGWSKKRLQQHTKMSEKQITENIDAYKLMEEQYLPKYQEDQNEVSKFSYFVEFAKDKKLQLLMTKSSLGPNNFCNWVADRNKIPIGQNVRNLRHVFENEDSKKAFLQNGFSEAMEIIQLKKPNIFSSFYKDVESVIHGLRGLSMNEVDEIINEDNGERERMLNDLARWSKKIIQTIGKEKNDLK